MWHEAANNSWDQGNKYRRKKRAIKQIRTRQSQREPAKHQGNFSRRVIQGVRKVKALGGLSRGPWLRLCVSNAGVEGPIPGQGAKTSHATQGGQKF